MPLHDLALLVRPWPNWWTHKTPPYDLDQNNFEPMTLTYFVNPFKQLGTHPDLRCEHRQLRNHDLSLPSNL